MRKIIGSVLLALVIFTSCNRAEDKIRYKDTIDSEDLIQIILDIHLTDGLMDNPDMLKKYPGADSLANYRNIFKNYGYGIEDFENTLSYYADKPDEFELIYEQILNRLSEMDGKIKSTEVEDFGPEELWNQKFKWSLPEDGKQSKIPFSIELEERGTYVFSVRIKMYPEDQSQRPMVSAWFWYDNGTEKGATIPFLESKITKDGEWKEHMLTKSLSDPKFTHLKGYILDHSDRKGNWSKRAEVEQITIRKIEY